MYVEKRPSSCLSSRLSYRLFITFLPKKQCLSPTKNLNTPRVCDENKSLRWSALKTDMSVNFRPENGLSPHERKSQIDRGDTGKDLENTPTSSSWPVPSRLFRSRSASFLCEIHGRSEILDSVWITICGELTNHSCGFYASSPVWMGLVLVEWSRSSVCRGGWFGGWGAEIFKSVFRWSFILFLINGRMFSKKLKVVLQGGNGLKQKCHTNVYCPCSTFSYAKLDSQLTSKCPPINTQFLTLPYFT